MSGEIPGETADERRRKKKQQLAGIWNELKLLCFSFFTSLKIMANLTKKVARFVAPAAKAVAVVTLAIAGRAAVGLVETARKRNEAIRKGERPKPTW